jgi:hypothetical protein
MFLYGYVFIRTVSGENITAPEGLHVYAKVGEDATVGNTTVWTEGRYTLSITGPGNGTQVHIFVQDIEVTNAQYQDWDVTYMNLTVIDVSPPVIEPCFPAPAITSTQLPPLWMNATITDDLALNETSIMIVLNKTRLASVYNSTSDVLACEVEQPQTGFYIINVTCSDLSGNTASTQWNFTLLIPQPPEVEILSPTTENPAYTHPGETIQIRYNYSDLYPKNGTLAIYNATLTIGQSYIVSLNETAAQRNDAVTSALSAPDGKYAVSVTIFNLFNLSQKAEQTVAVIIDGTPPTIERITQTPESGDVQPTDPVTINATIKDVLSGVLNATLYWRTQDGEWNLAMMNRTTDDSFSGNIPPLQISTTVYYEIEAFDKAGNQAIADNAGQFYTYHVIPEYPITTFLIVLTTPVLISMLQKIHRKFRKQ